MPTGLSRRFLETTRGQVLRLLRRGGRTVEELADALALTDNAIRAHLATLERDGFVKHEGVRRSPGAGKPAVVYEALVGELTDQLPREQRDALFSAVGRRIAAASPMRTGSVEERLREAVTLLNELGGDAALEADDAGYRLRACGCPLSAAVARQPETCRVVQELLSEVIGMPVTKCCEYGRKPQCCFTVPPAA